MSSHAAITALLVLAYVGLLTWTLKRRGPVLQGRWLFFLRAFFPNWKFFHAVGRAPRLYVRGRNAQGHWGDWQAVYPRLPRRWHHLLHNPVVNLALTQQNLVDHLAHDINDLPEGADIRSRVSYQLVARLAQDALAGGLWGDVPLLATPLPGLSAFQFELRMERPDLGLGQAADSVQMLLSPVLSFTASAASGSAVMASEAKPSSDCKDEAAPLDRHGLRPRDDGTPNPVMASEAKPSSIRVDEPARMDRRDEAAPLDRHGLRPRDDGGQSAVMASEAKPSSFRMDEPARMDRRDEAAPLDRHGLRPRDDGGQSAVMAGEAKPSSLP